MAPTRLKAFQNQVTSRWRSFNFDFSSSKSFLFNLFPSFFPNVLVRIRIISLQNKLCFLNLNISCELYKTRFVLSVCSYNNLSTLITDFFLFLTTKMCDYQDPLQLLQLVSIYTNSNTDTIYSHPKKKRGGKKSIYFQNQFISSLPTTFKHTAQL